MFYFFSSKHLNETDSKNWNQLISTTLNYCIGCSLEYCFFYEVFILHDLASNFQRKCLAVCPKEFKKRFDGPNKVLRFSLLELNALYLQLSDNIIARKNPTQMRLETVWNSIRYELYLRVVYSIV